MRLPLLIILLSGPAQAEAPKLFDQDPICDSAEEFRKELDKARPLHRKYPQLKAALADQNKWFGAVTSEMGIICAEEKKFAAKLLSMKRGGLSGQCKPAEEAALYDQEMLEHSERNLSLLKTKKEGFLVKGIKGVTDPLPQIAERNIKLVGDYAFTLGEVDPAAYCELKWLYPPHLRAKIGETTGCGPLEWYDKAEAHDKKEPSLASTLLRRFELSITYNTSRRDKAAVAAKASRDRYEACVAQNPEVQPHPLLGKRLPAAKGAAAPAPAARNPSKGSDITGTEQDQKKRERAKGKL